MTEKLYWEDAYQTKFQAKVTNIKSEGIILDRTLFYPESGNQASDRGHLFLRENRFKVDKVTKENGEIIHHITSDFKNKIKIGDTINGEIDWDYRYGIMKAHSSQHIFSALLKEKYDIDTLRATLNFEEVFLQLSQEIDLEQLKTILEEVNKICNSLNLNLSANIISVKEAKQISKKIRSVIPNEPKIRLIKINNLDLVCCGGTHVKNSIEIGNLFVFEFKRGKELRYVIGDKAIEMSSRINADLIAIANDINSPIIKLKTLVKKRLDFMDNIQEQNKSLSIRLIELISNSPLRQINQISLFYIDFDVDIKILNRSLENFPSKSLIIVEFESNKLRILSPSEIVDSNKLLQKLIKKFGGKGGGNPKSSQGFLKEMPKDILFEIESLLKTGELLK